MNFACLSGSLIPYFAWSPSRFRFSSGTPTKSVLKPPLSKDVDSQDVMDLKLSPGVEMARKSKAEFFQWMGPMLDAIRDLGGSGKPREVVDRIAEQCDLSDARLEETLKSGRTRFDNQTHWARQYLVWEGLLDSSTRGVWTLTPKGYETSLDETDARKLFLKWVKIHAAARKKDEESPTGTATEADSDTDVDVETETDEASQEDVFLALLKRVTPQGFERICALLLRESGFVNVSITGGSADEGIDGIGTVEVNPFVTFKVLFQCKRYKGTVSRAQVGDFRNAMIGRVDKGVIMTTGTFSRDAIREADRDGAPPVELVDGRKLVEMFKRVELGLHRKTIYEVDRAFFAPYLPTE